MHVEFPFSRLVEFLPFIRYSEEVKLNSYFPNKWKLIIFFHLFGKYGIKIVPLKMY
jgi:hypothetical protein